MAYSLSAVVAAGDTNVFPVPFPYLSKSHVHVTVDGAEVLPTWPTGSTVQLPGTGAALTGKRVLVRRITPVSSPEVAFQAGGLDAKDLNRQGLQLLYCTQEAVDLSLRLDAGVAIFDAQGKAIKGAGDPVDSQDVVTRQWAETAMSSSLAQAKSAAQAANYALAQIAADQAPSVDVRKLGAVGDGTRRPLGTVTQFGPYNTAGWTLAQWQAVYPHALALSDELDWCAIQLACNMGYSPYLPFGFYVTNRTISFAFNGIVLQGAPGYPQIRRYGDFGPTIKTAPVAQVVYPGIEGVFIYDAGVGAEVMTQANSPVHVLFDTTRYARINNVFVVNGPSVSTPSGIALLGCVDFTVRDTKVALQNGAPALRYGLRIGRGAVEGSPYEFGGGKSHIDNLNIEGGYLTFTGSVLTGRVDCIDNGLLLECGDGLWINGFHTQFAAVADMHIITQPGVPLSNLHMSGVMLDICGGHGLFIEGNGRTDRWDLDGQISASGIGAATSYGVFCTSEVHGFTLNAGIEGFGRDAIRWQSPLSSDIVINPRTIRNCNKANGGFGGIYLISGSRFTIGPGRIGGDGSLGFGLRADASVSGLTLSGTSMTDGTAGSVGVTFSSGCSNVSFNGGAVMGFAQAISNNGTNVKVRGVLGLADIG